MNFEFDVRIWIDAENLMEAQEDLNELLERLLHGNEIYDYDDSQYPTKKEVSET